MMSLKVGLRLIAASMIGHAGWDMLDAERVCMGGWGVMTAGRGQPVTQLRCCCHGYIGRARRG